MMIWSTFLTGIILIFLGLGGYFAGNAQSPTALIPAGFGLTLLLIGLIAQKIQKNWAFMLSAIVAILGLIGVGMRLPKSAAAIDPASSAIPMAFFCQSLMALICLIYALVMIRALIVDYVSSKTSHEHPEVID